LSRAGFTGEQRARASELIRFIFSLPELSGEPPLLLERSMEKFFSGIGTEYSQLFSYNGWFDDMDPDSIDRLLLLMLRSVTNEKVLAVIREFVEGADFTLFDEFTGGSVPNDFRREKIYSLAESLLGTKTARPGMNSVYCVIRYGMAERYLGEVFRKLPGAYGSMVSAGSRKLTLDESAVFFKTALILANCRNMPDGPVYPQSFPDIAALCGRGQVRDSGEGGSSPSAWDFINILDLRFRNSGYYEAPSDGCMTADASWFDTVRRPGLVSLDHHLAGVLCEIAMENNW